MHNLDLRDFARYSQKIPSNILNETLAKKKTSTLKILMAHALDATMVFYASIFMLMILGQYTSTFLVSSRIIKLSQVSGQHTFTLMFPVLLFTYFVVCNFYNHGQSYGMHSLKLRLRMKEQSFTQSFQKAAWSFLLCLSAGTLIGRFRKENQVENHDWLYQELLLPKEYQAMNLLECVEAMSVPAQEEEEIFTIAA